MSVKGMSCGQQAQCYPDFPKVACPTCDGFHTICEATCKYGPGAVAINECSEDGCARCICKYPPAPEGEGLGDYTNQMPLKCTSTTCDYPALYEGSGTEGSCP